MIIEYCIHVPVLLNLLNLFGKMDKMLGKASLLIFCLNSFSKFKILYLVAPGGRVVKAANL